MHIHKQNWLLDCCDIHGFAFTVYLIVDRPRHFDSELSRESRASRGEI